jgi:hypothetical protein
VAGKLSAQSWLERSLLLIALGLVVQLFTLVHVTPGSFLIFAGAGVGSVLLGLVLFAVAVTRRRGAGQAEQEDADAG